jgi:cyclophilin family peptidyl-prolyl cis-trans isomerase
MGDSLAEGCTRERSSAMKRIAVVGMAALVVVCCSVLSAQDGKVHKVWPEVEELAKKTWRPIVAVFAQQGDSQFMGTDSSVMGDKKLSKILKYLILLQIDLTKKGTEEKLSVADDKNRGAMSKLIGTAKTLPIVVVAGPDMKPVKLWEKADPAAVKREIGQVLVGAIKKYDPLDDDEVKEAEGLIEKAAKEEERGKDEDALKSLKKVIRMNKNCGLAKEAQEIIDRLTGEKKESGITDFDEEGEEEKKEEEKEKPEPSSVVAVMDTDMGRIEIELLLDKAPKTCEHFMKQAKAGIYNGATFDYVEKGKLVQCVPDKSKKLPAEIEADFCDLKHEPGIIAMAKGSSAKKIGAAFYIAVKTLKERDGEHAIFGRIKSGLMVAKTIATVQTVNGKPVNKITISKITIKE